MHAGVSSSSQVGEVLAITLLNNSDLSDETLSNAKIQLVAMTKAKQATAANSPSNISSNCISQIKRVAEEMSTIKESSQLD